MGFRDQVMFAPETTHGTYATPTRSLEVNGEVEGTHAPNIYQGSGMVGAGYYGERSVRRRVVTSKATLAFGLDVRYTGMGLLLDQLFASTPAPAQQGGTAAYSQTHVLATPGAEFGATVQVGMSRAESSTVDPYSYLGAVMTEATFTQDPAPDAPLMMDTVWDARAVTDAQSLETFSPPTGNTFALGEFGFKVHNTPGSEAAVEGVRGLVVTIKRPFDTERFTANNSGLRRRPVLNSREEAVTGKITADHIDKATFNDRFLADTGFSMVAEWVGPIIASTFRYTFRLTLPRCYITGPLPALDGPAVVSGEFDFTTLDNDTNELVTATYISTDTAL